MTLPLLRRILRPSPGTHPLRGPAGYPAVCIYIISSNPVFAYPAREPRYPKGVAPSDEVRLRPRLVIGTGGRRRRWGRTLWGRKTPARGSKKAGTVGRWGAWGPCLPLARGSAASGHRQTQTTDPRKWQSAGLVGEFAVKIIRKHATTNPENGRVPAS